MDEEADLALVPRREVVDGVPVYWSGSSGDPIMSIMFRVGSVDEAFAHLGVSHAVEHLALNALRGAPYRFNGQVGPTTTVFAAAGAPDELVAFATKVCDSLRNLHVERLRHELRVLHVEAQARVQSLQGRLLSLHCGYTPYRSWAYAGVRSVATTRQRCGRVGRGVVYASGRLRRLDRRSASTRPGIRSAGGIPQSDSRAPSRSDAAGPLPRERAGRRRGGTLGCAALQPGAQDGGSRCRTKTLRAIEIQGRDQLQDVCRLRADYCRHWTTVRHGGLCERTGRQGSGCAARHHVGSRQDGPYRGRPPDVARGDATDLLDAREHSEDPAPLGVQ